MVVLAQWFLTINTVIFYILTEAASVSSLLRNFCSFILMVLIYGGKLFAGQMNCWKFGNTFERIYLHKMRKNWFTKIYLANLLLKSHYFSWLQLNCISWDYITLDYNPPNSLNSLYFPLPFAIFYYIFREKLKL